MKLFVICPLPTPSLQEHMASVVSKWHTFKSFSKYNYLLSPMLQLHNKFVPSSSGITCSNLERNKQSVSIGTVSCTTIYPCSVRARMADALILVGALDGCSIVTVSTEAHF